MGYGGWILVTTTVASQADLKVIRLGFKAVSPPGTKFYLCLPQSKSYLKVINIPFFKTLPYASGDVRAAFAQSPLAPHLNLMDKPRIVCISRASNMCTTWFKIWDSQQGTSAQYLVRRTVMVNRVGSPIYAAKVNQGKSLCQKCWHWGHPTNTCCWLGYICPICGGPHQRDHHCMLCGPCKGNPKANPPVAATPPGAPCPHKFSCMNCKQKHTSDSKQCPFWKHHFNSDWIKKEYQQVREQLHCSRQLTDAWHLSSSNE
ncbi:Gag-like protein [Macrolepiota fuliginosa MF-IS2]|uniref:Gag-like protein n=1 Tax=Macrolepiota fuliginosa MF-IS2 TaxID=1400762 RepID=A0A9P5X0Z8_9AGAR|nr:Gag-like protein [Macrolepiota fuliginosa MF-IS2]